MKTNLQKATRLFPPIVLLGFFFFTIQSCQKETNNNNDLIADNLKNLSQTNLVGNTSAGNPGRIDPNLVNGWGIAISSFSTIWVSANGTGKTTVYDKDGMDLLPAIDIPSPTSSSGGHPTGQVFYAGTGFHLPNGNPAKFIFAGDDGVISGWNTGSSAVKMVDDSPDASYLGIAIATDGGNDYLYASNFAEKKIDVYDASWNEVTRSFSDPSLPTDYSPFNIQNIGGKLYVMYAKLGPTGDEVKGAGLGYVDIFNPDGSFVTRFISGGQLNAPWGIAVAPAGFWKNSGMPTSILVGNFGDGRINVYNAAGGFIGQLQSNGNPLEIDGLWGIAFAPSTAANLDGNILYFAAGPNDEANGLFGYIKK